MDYSKLKLSFLLLLIMTVLQFTVSLFVLHSLIITLLSAAAILMCLSGLIYVDKKTK
ncbi:MAG: hypothetical protein K0S71_712 [Clostridia bacterium]|jgi:hypothetical protein|nr:hypothetical protein [Clostridia bacterium]